MNDKPKPLKRNRCSRRYDGRRCKGRLLGKPSYNAQVCVDCGAMYPLPGAEAPLNDKEPG